MFRLGEACFCQYNPVLTECTPIDARGRDRYRYRNRDRTVIVEVDTDSDDSDTLAFVHRLSIGTDFNFENDFRDITLESGHICDST